MSDIELTHINSGYNLNKMNSNFDKIEGVVNDDILHRAGGNNTMRQALDMNSNPVINGYTDLSNPKHLLTVEAADRKYNTKLGNENTSGLGEFRFNSVDQLKAMTDISANTFTAADVAALADSGAVAHTNSYYLNTGIGGSKYQIRSLESYQTEIGDGSWVPDGYVDHYLIGGSEYIAVLMDRGSIDVDCCGAVGDGTTDDTGVFQAAVEAATHQVVFTRSYGIYDQIEINKNFFTVSGLGSGTLVNCFEEARGTVKSLLYSTGSVSAITTLSADLNAGSTQASVASATSISVGDVLSFSGDFSSRNISTVLDVSGTTITLDRAASNTCPSGGSVNLVTPRQSLSIGNFHIDFNGSLADPRYGFGVFVLLSRGVLIENISSKNVASKVVQVSYSLDGHIRNIYVNIGVDNFGTGGHGYGVRVAVSNDIKVSEVSGIQTRHVVDISGGSRNSVYNCVGYKTDSACFLTHGNNCKDNIFTNNYSTGSKSPGAYSFRASAGDTGNIVDGGYVEGGTILYNHQDGSNIVKNVVCFARDGWAAVYCGSAGGAYRQTYENCTFSIDGTGTITESGSPDVSSNIIFKGCTFNVSNSTQFGIANLGTASVSTTLTFHGCLINIEASTGLVATNSNCSLTFLDCVVKAGTHGTIVPLLTVGVSNSIDCINSHLYADSANSWFAINGPTTLTLHGCRFTNTVAVYRRYSTGDCNIIFGENHMVNSAYGSLANLGNLSTIGIPDMGLSAVPAGAWANESKILNSNPAAAATSPSFWIRKDGTWYGAGHLSTTIV